MRALLIVNTAASSVTSWTRVVIQDTLAPDHDLTVVETSHRGDAERLARRAAEDGADVVVVLGGDGTLNEAANGLVGSSTALAALPGGSTNVFARTIGVSRFPREAARQLLAALHRRAFRRVALGNVNGRRFLFHTGVGFDAAVVAQVERRHHSKRYAGQPLFVACAVLTWFRHYDHSRPRFSVELKPEGSGSFPGVAGSGEPELVDGCYFAIVSKTSPYTFLGPRPIVVAPEATLDSPLSLTVLRTLDFAPLIAAVASAMGRGSLLRRHPRILSRSGLSSFTVVGPDPFPYQVDGDHLGEVDRLEFSYEPDALTVVVP
jgi:diacylglycerol kinase family enzyme